MARINGTDLEALRAVVAPLDTETAREAYRRGDFPRSESVDDLDRRYRFDVFYATKGYRVLPDDVTTAHIDTALRSIIPTL